ncbi:MAG: CHC2 zinc finger domain-containing protein, partial [Nitrososphaera sp.]|nr:CHC2 zinc finger domain-containing protein [Nitrososphaera sp.]
MIEALLNKLDRCRATGPGRWMATCPVHEEKTPSLSIRELDDGRVLLYCFGCGAGAVDIIRAAGLEPDDVFPPRVFD